MSFELILPFLRPIQSLLLDDTVTEIMVIPMASGGTSVKAFFTSQPR